LLAALSGFAAVVLGVWIYTPPSVSGPCGAGEVRQSYAVISPDMQHVAYLCTDDEESAYWITLGDHWDESKPTEIVLEWTRFPDIDWRDDRHLVVTLHVDEVPTVSLHESHGVSVVFRIGDELSQEKYARWIDGYERQVRKILASINPNKEPEELADVAYLRDTYRRFKAWALENAENGSSR
jgi:hypothetical protein